jgi:GH24 family phage-related lysozyme (muramidase)
MLLQLSVIKTQGYGKVIGPAAPQGYRPAASGRVPPEAIKEVESGGRPGLVSSAGAEGTMQVMPNTQTDPGYGVTPAKDKSQAELERVGRDYYAAMQKQYGNDTLASIAYNMGPGATDSWLKKGGNFRDLPAETRDYIGQVHLATAKLNRAANTGAAPSAAPGRPLTIPEAEAKAAGQKSRAEAQGTAAGKYLGGAEATVREASSSSGERLASLDYLDGLINNPKTSRVFGVFEHPDFASAIGKVVDNGIKLGRLGDVGVDLAPIVRTVMKGATQEEIDAVQKATREFAKIKLNEAKILLAGQGAVSDAERGLVQELSGSIKNSPGALRDYLAWGKMRAEYDRNVGAAFKEYRRANRGASFEEFLDTGKADDLRDAYDEKLFDFARKTGIDMSKAALESSKQDQAKPKTEQAKPQYKFSDSDYEAWKKSKGLK